MSFEEPRRLWPSHLATQYDYDRYEKALEEAERFSEMIDDERGGYHGYRRQELARREQRDHKDKAHRYYLAHQPEIKFRRELKRLKRRCSSTLGCWEAVGLASCTVPLPAPAQHKTPIIIVIDDDDDNDHDVIFLKTRFSTDYDGSMAGAK